MSRVEQILPKYSVCATRNYYPLLCLLISMKSVLIVFTVCGQAPFQTSTETEQSSMLVDGYIAASVIERTFSHIGCLAGMASRGDC